MKKKLIIWGFFLLCFAGAYSLAYTVAGLRIGELSYRVNEKALSLEEEDLYRMKKSHLLKQNPSAYNFRMPYVLERKYSYKFPFVEKKYDTTWKNVIEWNNPDR